MLGNGWFLDVTLGAGQNISVDSGTKTVSIIYPAAETAGDVKTALETLGLTVDYVGGGAAGDSFGEESRSSETFAGGFEIAYPYFDLFLAR